MWFSPPLWAHTDQWCFLVSLRAQCSPDRASYFAHSAARSGPGYLWVCSGNDLWSPSFFLLPHVPSEGFPPVDRKQTLLLCWFTRTRVYRTQGLVNERRLVCRVRRMFFPQLSRDNIAQPQNKCLSKGFSCEYTVTQSRCSKGLEFNSWRWVGLF